jgi:2-oxoglutarate dehydrogenase E2 component (dihydrolipoamide succinyltransferase)
MATEVKVPNLGESVVEATVGRWLKKEGDAISVGDVLVELETDKVDVEVGAEKSGTLEKILKQEGEDVAVGDVLATIGEGAATGEKKEKEREKEGGEEKEEEAVQPAASTAARAPQDGERAEATPVARRMAQQQGVALDEVAGSGRGGRITKQDVQSHMQQKPAEGKEQEKGTRGNSGELRGTQGIDFPTTSSTASRTAPAAPAQSPIANLQSQREQRIRMSRRRRTIAQRLVEAQHTAAMLTTFNEIDMSAVMAIRARRKDSFTERHGIKLGFMSFFVKAAIGALKAFPQLNAEIQGDEIVLKQYYHIGMAIGAEEGLVVPVVRDADRLTFAQIEQAIDGYVKKVRDGSLSVDDLRGGTFTITNGGIFGSLLSTPILNPPEVGILGLHKIEERPIAMKGEVVIRPMMYVALSYDHRIVDGREAVQFLVRVKELIEDPETLLLEG